MQARSPVQSRYLTLPGQSLYEACRKLGRDDDGRACPTCPVRDICFAQRASDGPYAMA